MLTPPSIDQEITVTVDSLSHGGSGVCRYKVGDLPFVIFVPNVCPGDKARVRIIHTKKNYAEADVLEIIESSPLRSAPPCPVFGICGGCQWQHVSYAEQLKQKQLIVEHALARIAKEEGAKILPIIPSPKEYHYRNRAQFRAEGSQIGFYRRGTHQIIEFDKCRIVEDEINVELSKLKSERSHLGDLTVGKYEIFKNERGQVLRSFDRAHGEELGFSQVNTAQNTIMRDYLVSLLGAPKKASLDNLSAEGNLLDLYCGQGNFSFPLNKAGWRVLGVDANRQAINSAQKLSNDSTRFSRGDVVWEVKKLASQKRKFEAIVLDPPRIGAESSLWTPLAKLGAEKIISISCNPATFARDWARLKSKSEYRIESVQPFDMFPQTFHVEIVALAKK